MQTLIAIGALAITITFALSTQRSEIKTDKQKIMAETQILAGQIATNALSHISIQEFDENTRDREVDNPVQLTPAAFWTGGKVYTASDDPSGTRELADDVDDYHNMVTHRVTTTDGLAFDVDATVRYVNPDASPSITQTFQKEVIVTIRDVPRTRGGQQTFILPAPIELRQIISMRS